MFRYRGFMGAVSRSEIDGVIRGEVINSTTDILFEGETIGDAMASFHQAIDDYVAWCKRFHMQPKKLFSGEVPLKMPPALHGLLATLARQTGKSIQGYVLDVLLAHAASAEAKSIHDHIYGTDATPT